MADFAMIELLACFGKENGSIWVSAWFDAFVSASSWSVSDLITVPAFLHMI